MVVDDSMKVVPHGEVKAEKYEPLPKEKLYDMAGKPVYAVGSCIEPGWKVIRKIYISPDRVEIAFTDDMNKSYNMDQVRCYDREVPASLIADCLTIDDQETVDLIRNVLRNRRLA